MPVLISIYFFYKIISANFKSLIIGFQIPLEILGICTQKWLKLGFVFKNMFKIRCAYLVFQLVFYKMISANYESLNIGFQI